MDNGAVCFSYLPNRKKYLNLHRITLHIIILDETEGKTSSGHITYLAVVLSFLLKCSTPRASDTLDVSFCIWIIILSF